MDAGTDSPRLPEWNSLDDVQTRNWFIRDFSRYCAEHLDGDTQGSACAKWHQKLLAAQDCHSEPLCTHAGERNPKVSSSLTSKGHKGYDFPRRIYP